MKKNNTIVLDANTLISVFLLSDSSIAAQAYYKAKTTSEIVYSEETFNEFSDVFIRPKFDRYLPLAKRLIIIEDLRALAKIVPITNVIKACRDPKDDKYLELAISSAASYIITGDKDLLVLNPFEGIPILTPADFLKAF
jgi:putative PIN family toxin of toxin-antitoxin system